MKIAFDTNGNKVLKIEGHELGAKRGFSIQTSNNLPITHKIGVNNRTMGEVQAYVKEHGSERQKTLLGF